MHILIAIGAVALIVVWWWHRHQERKRMRQIHRGMELLYPGMDPTKRREYVNQVYGRR